MGRIKENIKVGGKSCWTLFDSRARNSYVTPSAARNFPKTKLKTEFEVKLGGELHKLNQAVLLTVNIRGKPMGFDAYVIDEIGLDENGKKIEVLFGALAMQKWGIRLDLKNEKLDLTHYSKEFLEF